MIMIEINAQTNGAHRNQTFNGALPDGWAIIPDDMTVPDTFPFVDITVEGETVTSMAAGIVPEPEPEPTPEPTDTEVLNALLGASE